MRAAVPPAPNSPAICQSPSATHLRLLINARVPEQSSLGGERPGLTHRNSRGEQCARRQPPPFARRRPTHTRGAHRPVVFAIGHSSGQPIPKKKYQDPEQQSGYDRGPWPGGQGGGDGWIASEFNNKGELQDPGLDGGRWGQRTAKRLPDRATPAWGMGPSTFGLGLQDSGVRATDEASMPPACGQPRPWTHRLSPTVQSSSYHPHPCCSRSVPCSHTVSTAIVQCQLRSLMPLPCPFLATTAASHRTGGKIDPPEHYGCPSIPLEVLWHIDDFLCPSSTPHDKGGGRTEEGPGEGVWKGGGGTLLFGNTVGRGSHKRNIVAQIRCRVTQHVIDAQQTSLRRRFHHGPAPRRVGVQAEL